MQTFVQFFSKLVAPHLPPLMAQAWHLFLASQPVYQHHVINSTPDLGADQVLCCCCFCCSPRLDCVVLLSYSNSLGVFHGIFGVVEMLRCLLSVLSYCMVRCPMAVVHLPSLGRHNPSNETVCGHFIARFVLPETWQMQHAGWTDCQLAACIRQHSLVAVLEFITPTWSMSALSSCRVPAA